MRLSTWATSRRPTGSPSLLAARPRGEVPPFLRAQVMRAKALVAGTRGEDEDVEENLVAAEAAFRELGYPYWTARAQLDRAEWLARQGRHDESTRLAGEAARHLRGGRGAADARSRPGRSSRPTYVASLSGVESPTSTLTSGLAARACEQLTGAPTLRPETLSPTA